MTARPLALAVPPIRLQSLSWLGIMVVGAAAAALALVLPDFRLSITSSWVIYGILALSLAFVWGKVGIFSFGQPAFFGAGGYIYGIVAINYADSTGETLTAMAAAAVAGAIFAAIVGYFMFYGRVGNVYVAIITLALTLVLLTVVGATSGSQYVVGEARIGGYNGMTPIPRPILPWSERALDLRGIYLLTIVVATGAVLVLSWVLARPVGRIFAAVRENELRTELLGYDIRWHKLQAFALGGAVAGLAGGLFASWAAIITPSVFTLSQMALVVIWVLVGGRSTLAGAFAGALLVQGLSNYFGGSGGLLAGQTTLALGVVFVLFVLLVPNGLIPSGMALLRAVGTRVREMVAQREEEGAARPAALPSAIVWGGGKAAKSGQGSARLETRELIKAFGGLHAVDGVDLQFEGPGVYCLIGPNGAGKSTLFNLLTGRYAPSRGRIIFNGQDISRWAAHRRAQAGIGIKLQQSSIYPGLTVRENAWLAAYAASHNRQAADQETTRLLEQVGLLRRAGDTAGDLSHGEHQWLEIAMVLASSPSVILLDEPTAGMTRGETMQVVPLIRQLGERHMVIVVEHDMQFVERLEAPVIMLHQGKVFTVGRMEQLRQNKAVLDIYFGRGSYVEDSEPAR